MASKMLVFTAFVMVAMVITSSSAAPTRTKTDEKNMTDKEKIELLRNAVITIQSLLEFGMYVAS